MTTTHARSVHIDAPVEQVFDFVKDPPHFYAAFPDAESERDVLTDVHLTPEGVGSTYRWKTRVFGLPMHGVMTREDYRPNARIVDHSSTGPVWTWTFEPDTSGTRLTLRFDYSTKAPLMDKVVDRFAWRGDRDLDTILANLKNTIEGDGAADGGPS